MYFKDVARSYGLADDKMDLMGDVEIWDYIIMIQSYGGYEYV